MKRRAMLTGLAALAVLTACVNQGGTGQVKPGKASSAPGTNPAVVPSTGVDTALKPTELISKTRLRAPKTPSTLVSGTVSIDAGYVVASGAGRIIANDGASIVMPSALIGQDAAGIVAGGAGNIIANDGASIIANDGASIIANDGASLIGQDAAGIVAGGAGNYSLLQSGATATNGQQLPGAGMWVRVINLADNRPVALGVDDKGQDVFVVMTDAEGRYELHLPEALEQNVRIVASIPRSDDPRLTYNLVADPDGSKDARYDESAALASAHVRLAMVAKLDFLASDLTADYDLNRIQLVRDERLGAFAKPVVKDMVDRAIAAGLLTLPSVRKTRVVQRFADHLVALTDLNEISVNWAEPGKPPTNERSVESLAQLFTRITEATAGRMARGDINRQAYLVEANARRKALGKPPYRIRKPSDMAGFITEEFVGNPDGDRARLAELVLQDIGVPVGEYEHLKAVYNSIYVSLAANMFLNSDNKAVILDGLVAVVKEEGSARAPRLAPVRTPEPAPFSVPAAAAEAYDVSTLTGMAGPGEGDGPAETAKNGGPFGLALGPGGALYYSDPVQGAIRKIDLADPAHAVTTVADENTLGATDVPVGLGSPNGIAIDMSATPPVLYFADGARPSIRKLTLPSGGEAGRVSTVTGPDSGLIQPMGLALDGKGGLVVADYGRKAVFRLPVIGVNPTLTTLVSSQPKSHLQSFSFPIDVAVGPSGELFVVDNTGNSVYRLGGDRLDLLAGSTGAGVLDGYFAGAKFAAPSGIAIVPKGRPDAGSLIVTEAGGHTVRRVRLDEGNGGLVTTLAGGGEGGGARPGSFADGPGASARFNTPVGVVVAADGTIYVADRANYRIRILKPRAAN